MSPYVNGRRTVLIVEDEEVVRMAVMDELNERGLEVLGAPHAMAALTIIESDAPVHLLITDIGLPGLDGRRFAEMARKIRPGLRVLFLTGYPIGHEGAAAGTRFVEKPVELGLLASIAEEMAEEADDQLV